MEDDNWQSSDHCIISTFVGTMTVELKDWLNSINLNKKDLIKEDPSVEKKYPAYIINKCMAGHIDTIMFANEMNICLLYTSDAADE